MCKPESSHSSSLWGMVQFTVGVFCQGLSTKVAKCSRLCLVETLHSREPLFKVVAVARVH